MDRPRVAIVIPAFNEAKNIAEVINAVKRYGEVIVVDDGSVDKTNQITRNNGAIVITHEKNLGYDISIWSGISYAIECGYDYAITTDADGQLPHYLISNFIDILDKNFIDIVVGVRKKKQRWSETIFSIIARFKWGIYDPLCGMKGYRLKKVLEISGMINKNHDFVGTRIAVLMAKKKFNIDNSISIETKERDGKSTFGIGIKPNIKIIWSLINNLIG
jgi:glycosyltransferase involved in cell wall biosynthesis